MRVTGLLPAKEQGNLAKLKQSETANRRRINANRHGGYRRYSLPLADHAAQPRPVPRHPKNSLGVRGWSQAQKKDGWLRTVPDSVYREPLPYPRIYIVHAFAETYREISKFERETQRKIKDLDIKLTAAEKLEEPQKPEATQSLVKEIQDLKADIQYIVDSKKGFQYLTRAIIYFAQDLRALGYDPKKMNEDIKGLASHTACVN